MRAYDYNPEQVMAESSLDQSVSQKMMQEVMASDFDGGRDSRQMQEAPKSSIFDRQWQADSGGKLVQLDMMTGKLLTHDNKGRSVDYEAHFDSERMSSKNSIALSSFFMLSPIAMIGMGTAFSMVEQVEVNQQSKEVTRLTDKLSGNRPVPEQPGQQAKGYTKEMVLKSMLLANDKRQSSLDNDIRVAQESYAERQKRLAFDRWIKEVESGKVKQKKKLKDTSDLKRRYQKVKTSMSFDQMMTVGKLTKRKRQIEDQVERLSGSENSLAEASRLHSNLEVLDKAIMRLSQLGY